MKPRPSTAGAFCLGDRSIPAGSALSAQRTFGSAALMDLHFDCTQCGRCCHDLRLTLSVDEARAWAGRGHQVDLLAEGWPWPDDGDDPEDGMAQWRKATSFPVLVGDVPFRINLRLVARHDGPCPHLLPDMRCGNYEARPRICRIYPPLKAARSSGSRLPSASARPMRGAMICHYCNAMANRRRRKRRLSSPRTVRQ